MGESLGVWDGRKRRNQRGQRVWGRTKAPRVTSFPPGLGANSCGRGGVGVGGGAGAARAALPGSSPCAHLLVAQKLLEPAPKRPRVGNDAQVEEADLAGGARGGGRGGVSGPRPGGCGRHSPRAARPDAGAGGAHRAYVGRVRVGDQGAHLAGGGREHSQALEDAERRRRATRAAAHPRLNVRHLRRPGRGRGAGAGACAARLAAGAGLEQGNGLLLRASL